MRSRTATSSLRSPVGANDRPPNKLAHLIDAHFALDEVTADPAWVELAPRQLDAIAAGTDTWYRGGVGCSTPRYSSSLVRNGSETDAELLTTSETMAAGFETADAADLPAGWFRSQAGLRTGFRDPQGGVAGSAGVALISDERQWVSLERAFTRLCVRATWFNLVEVTQAFPGLVPKLGRFTYFML